MINRPGVVVGWGGLPVQGFQSSGTWATGSDGLTPESDSPLVVAKVLLEAGEPCDLLGSGGELGEPPEISQSNGVQTQLTSPWTVVDPLASGAAYAMSLYVFAREHPALAWALWTECHRDAGEEGSGKEATADSEYGVAQGEGAKVACREKLWQDLVLDRRDPLGRVGSGACPGTGLGGIPSVGDVAEACLMVSTVLSVDAVDWATHFFESPADLTRIRTWSDLLALCAAALWITALKDHFPGEISSRPGIPLDELILPPWATS